MKLGSELAFQVDLAAAAIAVLALLFSIRAGMRQRRHERETLHLQRDSDGRPAPAHFLPGGAAA